MDALARSLQWDATRVVGDQRARTLELSGASHLSDS